MIKHIIFQGEKIPIEFYKNGECITLNENKKDYPDKVNQILYKKYPKVRVIEHNSHYNERMVEKWKTRTWKICTN